MESTVTLLPGAVASQPLVAARPGEGQETWMYRFGDESNFHDGVILEVPRTTTPRSATYSRTLTWTLASVPINE